MSLEILDNAIRRIPDFPKKGILFYDITGVLVNPPAFKFCLDKMVELYKDSKIDAVAGIGDKSISDGLIYVKGKVYVNILYIPDGESELPVSIKTSIDFKNKIDNPKITQDMKLKVICDVTKIDFEVLNSRKLALKATVSTSYEVVGEKEIEYCVGFDNTNCEYIKNEYALDTIGAFDDFDFVLRDSMEIASGKSSIKEILNNPFKKNKEDNHIKKGYFGNVKGDGIFNDIFYSMQEEAKFIVWFSENNEEAEFDIMYGQGISKESELLDIAVKLDIVDKSGAWFSYKGERLGQGRDNVKELLRSNTALCDEIEAKVRENMDKLSDLSKPAKKSKILSVAPTGIDIEADVDDEE